MNPNAIQSWKTTPTIIIEYVDCHTAHTLEPLQERANDVATETNENFHNVFSSYDVDLTLPPLKTKPPTITPEVDAYVTPLSLCHTEESNETFEKRLVSPESIDVSSCATSVLETSFTSVDIGSNDVTTNGSWTSESSHQGCCDIKSGIVCVTQVLTGMPTSEPTTRQTPENPYLDLAFHTALHKKRQFSHSSMIGMFCFTVSIICLIAVGIAMYIELVTNPPSTVSLHGHGLKESYMCELLTDSCGPRRGVMDSFNFRNNNTSNVVDDVNNNRVQAMFSSPYRSQINVQLHDST